MHNCHCHADGKPGAGQGRGWWAHSSCVYAQRGRRAATCQQPVARTERMPYHPCNRPAQGDHCTTVIPAPPRRHYPRKRESRVAGRRGVFPSPPRPPRGVTQRSPQARRSACFQSSRGGPARKQLTFLHFFRFRSPRKKTEDNQPNYDDQMSLPPDGAMQASGAPGPAAVDRAAGLCRGSGVGDAAVRCY